MVLLLLFVLLDILYIVQLQKHYIIQLIDQSHVRFAFFFFNLFIPSCDNYD